MQADIWLRCILEIVIKAYVAQLQAHMINQWIYPIIMLSSFQGAGSNNVQAQA